MHELRVAFRRPTTERFPDENARFCLLYWAFRRFWGLRLSSGRPNRAQNTTSRGVFETFSIRGAFAEQVRRDRLASLARRISATGARIYR